MSTSPPNRGGLTKLKGYLITHLTQQMDSGPTDAATFREVAMQRLEQLYTRSGVDLPADMRSSLLNEVLNEVAGYGPIQPLLEDSTISEIMVNGPNHVYIEREGEIFETGIKFDNDDHVLRLINRIVLPMGRRIDRDSPAVDARLPDGSRVNAVIPPVAVNGPCLTIRKFLLNKMGMKELIEIGSLTQHMADFLKACVSARLNILVSGPTSSGKTTFLNVLSNFIPDNERIITIEDAVELQLHQRHVVSLETKQPNSDGSGAVNTRDLVRNTLRMRPDRIVVGEVRGAEALDMLQAMNTGHNGSMTTLHANSPRDALSRLETMVLMAGLDLPLAAVRRQISSALNLVIHQARMIDGTRKIVQISEVSGMEGDTITMSDIFKFEQTGISPDGKVLGRIAATGIRPLFMPRLEVLGYRLGADIFGAGSGQERRPTGRR